MPETAAIKENIRHDITERKPEDEIQLLWLSRFDPSKGVMFLLKALRLLPKSVRYKLTLAGDGIQQVDAIRFCEENNLNYEYIGIVPHHEIENVYDTAHLFFLTSMMDATTSVVFEALSRGLPVIALDHLSFGEVIDRTCGHKIRVGTQEQISQDIAESITFYYTNEIVRRKDAHGALAKAKNNSWDSHIRQLNSIYGQILQK